MKNNAPLFLPSLSLALGAWASFHLTSISLPLLVGLAVLGLALRRPAGFCAAALAVGMIAAAVRHGLPGSPVAGFDLDRPVEAVVRVSGHWAPDAPDDEPGWSAPAEVLRLRQALEIDPRDPRIIYAVFGYQVVKSVNAGRTWDLVTDGLEDVSSVETLILDPESPNMLYIGTGEGVFKSTDGGATWESNMGLPEPFGDFAVVDLALDVRGEQTLLYAATSVAGVFRSTDRGATWEPLNEGLPILLVDSWRSTAGGLAQCSRVPLERACGRVASIKQISRDTAAWRGDRPKSCRSRTWARALQM